MPKVSVYVPDELLEQAKKLNDSDNTSRLIQRGLERLVEEHTRVPSYAKTPTRSYEQIVEVRDRLLAQAREDYEFGYTVALDAASAMPLHVINDLATANFDLAVWLKPYVAGRRYELVQKARPVSNEVDQDAVVQELKAAGDRRAAQQPPNGERARQFMKYMAKAKQPWWWLDRTADALGMMADPIGYDEFAFTPTLPRQRGYIDAMRELWSAIENPGHSWSDSLHELNHLSDELGRIRSEGGEADRVDDEEDDS